MTQPGSDSLPQPIGANDWQTTTTSAVTPTSSTQKKPSDFWGLGQVYGQPILLGTDTQPGVIHPGKGPAGAELGMGPKPSTTDVWRSAQAVMSSFSKEWSRDPAGFAKIQAELAAGGYYGSTGKYVPGRYDTATKDALKKALGDYVAVADEGKTPVTLSEFLKTQASVTQQAQANQPQTKIPAPSLTDTSQLRLQVQEAAQSALGRNLSQKEVNAFVNEFHSRETQAFNAAQAGGQAYVNPDPSTSAAEYVQQNNGVEAKQQDATAYVDSFLNMFLSGSSAAPSRTIDPALTG